MNSVILINESQQHLHTFEKVVIHIIARRIEIHSRYV